MAQNQEIDAKSSEATAAGGASGQSRQLGLRLQSVDHSDQPVFSNFTMVQGAPGMVFLDFGFLEPSAMPALARLAKTGGKMPEAINGRLACRIVLGVDSATQLTQQLEAHLRALSAQGPRPAKTEKAAG